MAKTKARNRPHRPSRRDRASNRRPIRLPTPKHGIPLKGNLVDSPPQPNKIIIIGESGSGKTGAKAALICAGYKIRSLDTDNGTRLMRALMTDPRYPYAKIVKDRGINLRDAFQSVQIETPMIVKSVSHSVKVGNQGKYETITERSLVPKDGKAWSRLIDALCSDWKDGDTNYGPPTSWGLDTVLDIDSFTTAARQSYYFNQEFNGRLGALEEGFSHQKDVGGAQSQLRRLLELLFNPALGCHNILTCHINRIDDSRGYSQTPEQKRMDDPAALLEIKGYPQAVGIQLSKNVPIYFNDSFVFEQRGSGNNVKRTIHTVPTTINGVNVPAKSSAWVEPSYDQRSGLYQIFERLQYREPDKDLVREIENYKYTAPVDPNAPIVATIGARR